MNKSYLAAPPGEWRHPDDHKPPMATKIRIYTSTGIEIHGHWAWTPMYVLWQPLTQLQPEMRERLIKEGKL